MSQITETLKGLRRVVDTPMKLNSSQRVFVLCHHAHGRCHACGEEREVFSLERTA